MLPSRGWALRKLGHIRTGTGLLLRVLVRLLWRPLLGTPPTCHPTTTSLSRRARSLLGWADELQLLESGGPGGHGLPITGSQQWLQPESRPPELGGAGRGGMSCPLPWALTMDARCFASPAQGPCGTRVGKY